MYLYELLAELTLAFSVLAIGVGACLLSWKENKSNDQNSGILPPNLKQLISNSLYSALSL